MPFLRQIIFYFFSFVLFASQHLDNAKPKLSDYGFFKKPIKNQIPKINVFPYKISTPLFTDYAIKSRFIVLPQNEKIEYLNPNQFHFPIGTILIKTFYYPEDFRYPNDNIRIIETRLLIHTSEGWLGFPYIWNTDQSDALLDISGGRKLITWNDKKGHKQSINYLIPNFNMCKDCHVINNAFQPIGPKPRLMNCDNYYNTFPKNQLTKMMEMEMVTDIPDISTIPLTAIWDDPKFNLDERARAYLDINCAHCHNNNGSANTSGLFLDYNQIDMHKLGIFKPPIAAGRGSGNLKYNIVPGKPEESILIYRMESTELGVLMPETGRKLVHQEGVELIKNWIQSMKNIE